MIRSSWKLERYKIHTSKNISCSWTLANYWSSVSIWENRILNPTLLDNQWYLGGECIEILTIRVGSMLHVVLVRRLFANFFTITFWPIIHAEQRLLRMLWSVVVSRTVPHVECYAEILSRNISQPRSCPKQVFFFLAFSDLTRIAHFRRTQIDAPRPCYAPGNAQLG